MQYAIDSEQLESQLGSETFDNAEQFNGKELLNQCSDSDTNYCIISIVGNDTQGRALKIKGRTILKKKPEIGLKN